MLPARVWTSLASPLLKRPVRIMKYFRLCLLLFLLRPCPACVAGEVVDGITALQTENVAIVGISDEVCQFGCPHRHEHDHPSHKTSDQTGCPCCAPDFYPVQLSVPVSAPDSRSFDGILSTVADVGFTRSIRERPPEPSPNPLPDRADLSLPLLI